MLFYLAQVMGAVALILTVIGVQFKKKDNIVFLNVFANIFVAIEYFLLGAITGAVVSILNAIRCFVFYLFSRKNLKPSVIVLVIFEIVSITSGILTWENWWSLIPIVVTMAYTYGLWQDNIFIIKLFTGFAGFGWAIYNFVVRAYVGLVHEVMQLISSIIAIIMLKKQQRQVDTNTKLSGDESRQVDTNTKLSGDENRQEENNF